MGELAWAVGVIVGALIYVWRCIWRIWSRLTMHINRCLLYFHLGGLPKTNRRLKAVLIGDGFCQSMGTSGQFLLPSALVHRLNLNYRNKPHVKLDWVFFERGYYMSTTGDWTPPNSSLFRRTFTSRACRDVDLVIVMVGLQDILKGVAVAAQQEQQRRKEGAAPSEGKAAGKEEEETTMMVPAGDAAIRNLEAIIRELRAQGRRVCVCDVPMVGKASGPLGRPIRELNHAIEELVNNRLLRDDPRGVVLAKMSSPRVEGPTKRSWDGIHLNAEGYKALCQELLDAIANQMVQVEWDVIKPQLTNTTTTTHRKSPPTGSSGVDDARHGNHDSSISGGSGSRPRRQQAAAAQSSSSSSSSSSSPPPRTGTDASSESNHDKKVL